MYEINIINRIFLVPNKKYSTKNYEYVKYSQDFLQIIENDTVGFFLVSKTFSNYPLYIERNEFFVNEEAYFVKQRYGGPYIDLSLYRGFADDSPIKYKRTWLSYYSKFIKLQEQYEEFKVTDKMIEFFKVMSTFLESKCKKVKVGNKSYWVSKEVYNELRIV